MERPERRKLDDEGLPLPPPAEGKAARWLLMIMERGEMVMFIAIALALLVIAVVVFVHGVHDLLLAPAQEEFAVAAAGETVLGQSARERVVRGRFQRPHRGGSAARRGLSGSVIRLPPGAGNTVG